MQRLLLVGFIALATLSACRSTKAPDPSASTVASMEQLQSELSRAKVDVNSTVAILNQLTSKDTDLQKQFKSLQASIKTLETKSQLVHGMRQSMDKQEAAFLEEWKGKLMRVANDDLRQQLTERRDATKAMFDELEKRCDTARATFDPWILQLNDVRKYLDANLSPSALESLSDTFDSINEGAPKLVSEIDAINEQITMVTKSIDATKAAAGNS